VLVLLGLGVWALIRYGQRPGDRGGGPGGRALEILKERYARGEITREEYEDRRRDLEG
jgi:putative membrane protein